MTVPRNRFYALIAGCVCICAFTLGIFCYFYFDDVHHVVLTQDGFKPQNVTLTEGDTVVFSSKIDSSFWPASNVHPTHTSYPDFDPKKPVKPNETWSFTFTKAGTYKFHDHIVSRFEGVITVKKKDGTRVLADCSIEKSQQCWEDLIIETLKLEGVKASFDKIVFLEETEPNFANDCHGLAHLIGKEAYELYAAKENIELTPATSLCGYGFYHGFMEAMLLTTGDTQEARAFCELVDEQLRGQASSASTACYHGIGHGAIDGGDPRAWGDPNAMVAPGFKLCSLVAQNELETYLCETGVFNALEILSADPKYGLTDLRENPMQFCNTQTVARREGCYANLLPIISMATDNDFQKVMDYVNANMIDHDVIAIDGNTVNDLTTLGIMFEYIRIHGEEPDYAEKGIEFCRKQQEDDHLPCIEGLSGGHIKYGEAGKEYVRNLEFCENNMLTPSEKDSCYKYTLPRLSGRYPMDQTKMICGLVDAEYRNKYCPAFF